MSTSNNIDYLSIVGPGYSSIATPEEVNRTYNNTTNLDMIRCQNMPSASVDSWLSKLPDNTGKSIASYSTLVRAIRAMAQN
jgi:hypothetical protein